MAEDTPGFSSLDSLGPAYGGINDPSLDAQGFAPFEGDKIERPEINFPDKPFFQATPSLDLDNPSVAVRQNVVGKPPHPPGKPTGKMDFNEYVNSLKAYTDGITQASQETNDYAKIYSYNAGPDGNAFYKRYHAYGQEKFDEVGFSPLRDNEALFNSRTTLGDDFKRMMTNSFVPMFTKGFISGPRDLAKLMTLDFSSDLEDAAEYEELAAIGQSSRGGVGAFANNTLMNFGYTAGIITEAIAEEVAGAVLAPVTGGGSLFAATANNARKVLKFAKPFEMMADGYKAVKNTLNSLNDIQAARKFWQATKTGLKSKAGRVLNPLENTMDAIIDMRALKASDNLTSLAAISKTAGGLYRDIRNINMATSEARLEAGMVENHLYDDAYNQFYALNHRAPNDQEQYDMMKSAKEGSMSTFLWNSALIYASNKITFDNITGPKGGIRNFIKSTKDEFMSVGGGKFGELGKIVYNKAAKAFEFEAKNVKNLAKAWVKNPGAKTLGKTAGYLKANISEGIQENLQEVIAGVNERYYKDAYKRSLVQSHLYNKALSQFAKSKYELAQEELGKQFSAQGFETFASGALMGVFASPLNQAIPLLTTGYNRMFNKENYQKYKTNKEAITKTLVETLNTMSVDEVLDAKLGNLGIQDIINEIKQTGSKKEVLDATTESVVEQLHVLNKSNVTDLYIDHLKAFTQMTPEELEDAMPNIKKGEGAKYIQKINQAIERIEKVKKKYDLYTEKFPNPVELSDKDDPDAEETKQKQFLYHAWDNAVKNAVYFNENFEDTMTRMTQIQETFLNSTTHKNLGQTEMGHLFSPNDMRNELAMLKADIANITATDPVSKKQLSDKKKKVKAMEAFIEKHEAFQKYYNRQDYYKSARKVFGKTLGREISDEELVSLYDEAFGKIDDEKVESKHLTGLHKAFKDYVKTIADVNEDYVFDEKLDDSFNLLLDHYKLASEAKAFNQYVNYLHDPGNFLKLVDSNIEWMKKLYENRAEYFQEVVKNQMEATEDQALLNKLADKHIFVDLDEFAKWKKDGIKPTQFFDDARKIVIPEGTTEYDKYYSLFEQLAGLRENPIGVSRDILAKELQDTLNKLDARMNAEIDALEKTETRVETGKIEPAAKRNSFTTNRINNELAIGESVDAVNAKGETLTFTKDAEGFLRDSEGNVPSNNLRFKSAVKYRMEMQADPELVREIEEKYAELKVKAREDYNAQVQQQGPGTAVEQSLAEYIQANPELYNELFNAFIADAEEKLGKDIFDDLSDEQKDNEFNKFLSTGKAEIIINEYKEKKKISEGTGEAEEFKFTFGGKEVNTADVTAVSELKKYIKGFMTAITTIRKKSVITPEDKSLLLDYELVINKLNALINNRLAQGMTPEMQGAIKLINKLQAMNKKANVVKPTDKSDYKVNGEEYERVSNVLKKVKTDVTYRREDIINDAFDVTIGKDGLSQQSIDNFINELRAKDVDLPGFFEFEGDRSEYPEGEILDTYDEIKADLESLLNEDLSDLNLQEFAINSVKEHTYQDSRNAGNVLDELTKNLFANKPVIYDPKTMTKEAFDALFGPDGYLTSLKQRADKGEFYVATENLVVWDTIKNPDGTETKVAGEIDLLVADRNGNIFIIDLKTGKAEKWANYNDPTKFAYNQKIGNTMQQTVYSNLLYNMLDINTKIGILPVELTYEPNGYIKTAGRPSSVKLFENDDMTILQENKPFTVTLDRTIVDDDINTIIPRKDYAPGPKPGEGESSDDQQSPSQQPGAGKPPSNPSTFKEYVNMINEASTLEELDDIALEANLLLNKKTLSQQEYNELIIRLDARKADMLLDMPGIEEGIKVGDTFFTQTDMGAPFPNGSEVVVTKLDNAKKIAYFKQKGVNPVKWEVGVPFDKLNEYFMHPIDLDGVGSEAANAEFEEPTLSPEEEGLTILNQNTVSDFLQSTKDKSAAVTNGKSLTDDTAENNIDDILNC